MVVLTEIISEDSSSSSSFLPNNKYDVFLSFRGEDTRYNFTDHLLTALHEATIDTFFDDEEIQIGDFLKPELESAIKSSKASIIVLSQNYATSTWCLDELALVMEQRKTSKHIIYPIFYHVNPSDVRKQRNSFGEAMAEHKQRMQTESDEVKRSELGNKIEKWKKALTEVANIKGKEANDCREAMLIKEIVKDISSRLELHKRSEIPKLIGMESLVETITSFLNTTSTEFLTIWGMAGIGKTHLADYVFKSHYLKFERSCFLEDIERRCTSQKQLLKLQKQLLKDIQARSWMDIDNVKACTSKIEKSLLNKRILLVLDGINDSDQLEALLGTKGLHPGSKVIITSKNGLLTETCRLFETHRPKHTKHLLQGLNDEESLQLLSWHAFGCNEPNKDDKKELEKVIQYCKGHPLALKVLGSSFRKKDATWEDILESLGNENNSNITDVLKISFDSLPSEKDKVLFKHIACLFVGEDRKFTEDILKACCICKSSGVEILINRCLLTVGCFGQLMMHQLLQDMGRDIVRQESPKKPWKRSILWHPGECLDVLQNRQGTPRVQGLVLDMRTFEIETSKEPSSANMQKFGFRSFASHNWVHILLSVIWWLFAWVLETRSSSCKTKCNFKTLSLSEMRNLKLLQLNYVQMSGSYNNFPQRLRWLCMHGFPLSYIPSDIQMENMVALDMSHSKLQQLWKTPKLLKSLKFLNLSGCHELVRVGHFSGLPQLERLTLAGCTSLVEICDTIGAYCQKLEVLDLSNCSKLKELPRSIGKLNNLIQLSIDGCSNIGDNINMKSHDSSSSTMVPRSSNFFMSSLPRSLVTLSLKNCNLYNESFPMDFSGLSILKKLYLDGNPISSMPDCVRSLSRLETLSFSRCGNLKTVMCAPIQLNHLEIDSCQSLERVTFNPELSSIPYITYYRTLIALTEIEHKFKIQALSEVDEEVLRSLGWISIAYLNHCRLSMANWIRMYDLERRIRIVPAQMLYEHGIFSTYLQGKEVPEWFTQRSSGSSFTLQSPPENGKIKGINVCIVRTISSMKEADPWRIKIRNLTKNSSWSYQPRIYLVPEKDAFEDGGEVDVIWLSHWMFGKNEFEDGDQVSIHFTVKYFYGEGVLGGVRYEPCVKVREYGMSTVYDDGGKQKKEDPLGYYKSWKYIIGGDLSPFEDFPSNYFLYSWRSILDFPLG